jgi:hypothetical protein
MLDDPFLLLVSMIVSTIGFGLLVYGKKQARFPQMGVGVLLMVFPYFVPSAIITAAIAAVLIGLMVFAIRAGM